MRPGPSQARLILNLSSGSAVKAEDQKNIVGTHCSEWRLTLRIIAIAKTSLWWFHLWNHRCEIGTAIGVDSSCTDQGAGQLCV